MGRPKILYFDERSNVTRRRGFRFGYLRWKQTEPPYHYEWRWFQIHVLTWQRSEKWPARKIQFEVKTYRTAGGRSIDRTKRYLRFGICI